MKSSVIALLKEACKFLQSFSNCQGAVVFLRDDLHKPLVARLTRGIEPTDLRAYCPRDVLEEVQRTRKSVLVMDSKKDSRFRDQKAPFRSAFYVPILDAQHRSIGLFYAMNSTKPVAFSLAHLAQVEDYARSLGEKLVELRWTEAEAPPPPPPPRLARLPSLPPLSEVPSKLKWLVPLALVLLLLTGFGVWRWKGRQSQAGGAPPVVSATATPNQPTGPLQGYIVLEGTLLQRPDFRPMASSAVARGTLLLTLGDEHLSASGSDLKLAWGGAFSASCRTTLSDPKGRAKVRLTVPGYKPVALTVQVNSGKASLGRVIFAPAQGFKK
ncbi:MAG: GAF domain-containing protein [Vulcanimicrobiota bacterium]